jgi:hypothetical protein
MRLRFHRLITVAALVGVVVTTLATVASATSSSDQTIARAGLLAVSDFPAGWQQHTRDSSGEKQVAKAAAKISECSKFATFEKAAKKTPNAKSPDFTLGQATVDNSTSVFPSVAKAMAAVKQFADASVRTCLQKLFLVVYEQDLSKDAAAAKTVSGVKVAIKRLSGVNFGDQTVSYEGRVDITLKDHTKQSLAVGFLAVRTGRAVSGFSYSYNLGTALTSVLEPAVRTSLARMAGALAALG